MSSKGAFPFAALFCKKERDAIDPTENRPNLPPQRKSQSRAEAARLSAPGEDPWTQDVRAEPERACASSLHPCRNAGKLSSLSRRTDRRSGDGASENLVPSTGGRAGTCKDGA